ncbi:MAG: SBBP repeat-containing protein, partial [Chloroflexales bacterium]|nr:SBBP repeat-containing protein [Chloroflexales bacterium]
MPHVTPFFRRVCSLLVLLLAPALVFPTVVMPAPAIDQLYPSRVSGSLPDEESPAGSASLRRSEDPAAPPDVARSRLVFIPNDGQFDSEVSFRVDALGAAIFFTPDEVVLALPSPNPNLSAAHEDFDPRRDEPAPAPPPPSVLRLRFDGAQRNPPIAGVERLSGVANFIRGNDPAGWYTGLPTYAGIIYQELYPGIDLRYDGAGKRMKGTYLVAPGADPRQIRWRYDGASDVRIDPATGDLKITVPAPPAAGAGVEITMTEAAPYAWQTIDGQQVDITVSYALAADNTVRFDLGAYDPAYPLTLDPLLEYSSYLGGNGMDEGYGIAADPEGNTYLTGETYSSTFPLENEVQPRQGKRDVFVSKFDASGAKLIYSTYLGGKNDDDHGASIAVDTAGSAYLTGYTDSDDFPTTPGAAFTDLPSRDAFVTKLAPAGALVYSSYLGGDSNDYGYGIAVDADGYAYVTGYTYSDDFPRVNAYMTELAGYADVFVTKFNQTGSALVYSTYLGGSDYDYGHG